MVGVGDPLAIAGPYAVDGLYTTVEDFYLLVDGLIGGKILNSEKMKALTGGEDLITWSVANQNSYGSGWLEWYVLGGIGNFGVSYLDPDSKSGLIVLSNNQANLGDTGEYLFGTP